MKGFGERKREEEMLVIFKEFSVQIRILKLKSCVCACCDIVFIIHQKQRQSRKISASYSHLLL